MTIFTPLPDTPIFNGVLENNLVPTPDPRPLTKRDRQRAGRLTNRVWRSISEDIAAPTLALTGDTIEIEQVAS